MPKQQYGGLLEHLMQALLLQNGTIPKGDLQRRRAPFLVHFIVYYLLFASPIPNVIMIGNLSMKVPTDGPRQLTAKMDRSTARNLFFHILYFISHVLLEL